ncbi:GFA family protein [Shewanella frigidimarina]|uniref:Aldehyde-activating protein n=1 Tax=Shewanella frigidimarina TaxID=56812 RepID=A0A106C0P4_SHEFR|nr:GFA family protein [Shewanella frigidimarina]KVX02100.1 aldehyde-activating protein [Shewanella frigidimarina]
MSKLTGNIATCLCGSVKIRVTEINPKYTVCHCSSCRKWGGGPLFMVQCGTDVEFEGDDVIKEFDSSAWASRGFCSNCGTHLFSRFKKNGSYNMPVGLFPNTKNLEMSMQYFIDLKPSYYCFANDTPEMTEAEIYTHFASEV